MILSRILNGQSKTITGAAIIISGATLISRLVGLLRDRIFAHYYGAGPVMDAYYAAFKIPDLVYNLLIVGALSAGFIPTFTRLFSQGEDKSAAWKLANNILNITAAGLFILSAFGIIFAPSLVPVIAPGFAADTKETVISFTRIMFGSTFLLGLSMVMGGVLQSLRSFFLYSFAPIFYNVGIIIGAAVLAPLMGASGLAWGVVLGAFLHFVLQAYSAYANGYRWHWRFNWKDRETIIIWKLMGPRTLGLAISQFNLVIVTVLASLLPSGSVSIFNYASNLQAVPIGIIGIPFALAVFPVLSAAAAKKDDDEFAKNLSATTRQILFLVIPVSIIVMLLRAQIVRVILGTGQFGWTATISTANALAMFALSLFAQCLIPLFARAFYALSDTKTPFFIGVFSEIIGIACSLSFMHSLGVTGLALAFSAASIINTVLLFIFLKIRMKKIDEMSIVQSFYKIVAASLVMALGVQFIKYPLALIFNQDYFWGILGQGLAAGIFGLAIYVLLCYLLKTPELMQIKDSLARRWLKTKNITADESLETQA